MRFLLVFAALSLALSAALAGPEEDAFPAEELAKAGQAFRDRCAECHQPPDLRFATDRAWLDQVRRTA